MAFNGYLKDMLWRLLLEHKTKNYSERLSIGNTSEFPSEPLDFESPIFLLTRNPCECDIVRNIWPAYFSEAFLQYAAIFNGLFTSLKSYVC